jgi:hypothetical protein
MAKGAFAMSIFQPLVVRVGVAHHYSAVPELSGIFMSHTVKKTKKVYASKANRRTSQRAGGGNVCTLAGGT